MASQALFFFSALGAFNSFMLALYFAVNANKKKFSNYFLSFLLLVLSVRIIKSVFFYFNPQLANIFIQAGLSACILIGPLLYLYIQSQTSTVKSNWKIHILPYLIVITVLGMAYPYVDYRGIWSRWVVKAIYLQWFIYIFFSFKYMLPVLQKLKKKEPIKKSDIWLLSIFSGVFLVWLAYTIAAYTSYIIGALSFTFVLYLIILLLIFKNDRSSDFFQDKEKYKNKEIDLHTLEHIQQQLTRLVGEEFFLNANLTLADAAKELKVTKHLLSQYLNEKLGKSFTQFINEYRIEKAKKLLQVETNYTMEGLGHESGFNSKSSFFTTFKKITGQTPSEYQKTQGF